MLTAGPGPVRDRGEAASWQEQRAELGRLLELGEPVPDAVLRRALAEQRFYYYLISFRGRPDMLKRFFRAPATLAYQDAGGVAQARQQTSRSPAAAAARRSDATAVAPQRAGELIGSASAALARWTRSGFARPTQEVYERRLAACLGCDQLSLPPPSLLSRIAGPGPADRAAGRVCGACGCPVTRKAGFASESCPLPDLADPVRTRWGEPRVTA